MTICVIFIIQYEALRLSCIRVYGIRESKNTRPLCLGWHKSGQIGALFRSQNAIFVTHKCTWECLCIGVRIRVSVISNAGKYTVTTAHFRWVRILRKWYFFPTQYINIYLTVNVRSSMSEVVHHIGSFELSSVHNQFTVVGLYLLTFRLLSAINFRQTMTDRLRRGSHSAQPYQMPWCVDIKKLPV